MTTLREVKKADAVFEGGGVKGIGLVGALQAFEEEGYQWQNVAGTSAGAITAALVAVGYTASEVRDIMDTRVEFRKFMDPSGVGSLPVVGPWLSLPIYKGMYRGDYFLALMRELVEAKGKKTFGDIIMPKIEGESEVDYETRYKYRLMVVASDISANELLVLPRGIARMGIDPDELEIALAVRMSMSIPYFFRPVVVKERKLLGHKHYIMDGGMLSNFPIDLFDAPPGVTPSWPTFGFLLWEPSNDDRKVARIRGLISMTKAIIETLTNAHNRKAIESADARRTIRIPTGKYTTTDFNLKPSDRQWLFDSGYNSAREFLREFEFERYKRMRTLQQAAQAV